jgi:hypothetical protein
MKADRAVRGSTAVVAVLAITAIVPACGGSSRQRTTGCSSGTRSAKPIGGVSICAPSTWVVGTAAVATSSSLIGSRSPASLGSEQAEVLFEGAGEGGSSETFSAMDGTRSTVDGIAVKTEHRRGSQCPPQTTWGSVTAADYRPNNGSFLYILTCTNGQIVTGQAERLLKTLHFAHPDPNNFSTAG